MVVEGTCGPGRTCIKVEGAKPSPDKVSFRFTEALQTDFCGSGDKAMHTTFRGNVIVELQPGIEGGRPVRGKVMNITLDFRPPSARRVVMAVRNERGQKAVAYLGLTIADETSPAAGGLRIAEARADSPAHKSGIAPGDVLLSFAGVNVTAVADIAAPAGANTVPVSVQRGDANLFRPADDIDPDYGAKLREAAESGVEIYALSTEVSPEGVKATELLPISLD